VSSTLCATVDVEDFYEGMAVLGVPVRPDGDGGDGMRSLVEDLARSPSRPRITLFVVGTHARSVADGLRAFAEAGHEIACHGADHGRLPTADLVGWLRRGRELLEDLVQRPVLGFRSPRFDIPAAGLRAYRQALAEAGYRYVSDAAVLGADSPVRELPVLSWRGIRVGGGSYQRVLPPGIVDRALQRAGDPAVVYYHSYDFDGSLPSLRSVRTPALAKQLLGRGRIRHEFRRLTGRYGSSTCADVAG
jgi:hypothetical protein